MPRSTSFRLGDEVKQRLAERAEHEGISATSLLERLIVEGIDTLQHAGVIHRGPPQDRRAALASGPDVWEVISRLTELEGSEADRIATLVEESDLHPRQVQCALEYAAHHPVRIRERIARHEAALRAGRAAAEQRRALLG